MTSEVKSQIKPKLIFNQKPKQACLSERPPARIEWRSELTDLNWSEQTGTAAQGGREGGREDHARGETLLSPLNTGSFHQLLLQLQLKLSQYLNIEILILILELILIF